MALNLLQYSHHFAILEPSIEYQPVIKNFANHYLLQVRHFKLWNQKVVSKSVKMFGVRTQVPLEFRFHINHMTEFINYLKQHGFEDINIIEVPLYEPAPAEFKIVTSKRPWDMQPQIIDYLCESYYKRIVELQAGQGKTLCALFAVERIGLRTLLILRPSYIERWMDDLAKPTGIFNLSPKELTVVKGLPALSRLIKDGLENKLTYKFIIISNKTMSLYYRHFISGENMDKFFGVKPHQLNEVLKIGVRLTDEAHQDFHLCFRTDLFTHVPKSIELSATLEPDDPFLKRMYNVLYPKALRFGGGVYKKYVEVFAIPFKLDRANRNRVSFKQKGLSSYSAIAFENSILKDRKRLDNYVKMIYDQVESYFLEQRFSDYKCLVFCARVEMCEKVADYIKSKNPHLKVNKYTQEEDPEILKDLDVIVSTPISAGTAIDIPRLQVCINSVSIGSTQALLQMIGRLRELRDAPHIKPAMVYLYCMSDEKPIQYHIKIRDQVFKDKVVSFRDMLPCIHFV